MASDGTLVRSQVDGVRVDASQVNGGLSTLSLSTSPTHANNPPVTTTISTIAVHAGSATIVIALLQSAQWIKVKILEMQPELAKLGSTLAEAQELQRQHEDVLIKLQAKQNPVEDLLNQADQLISTQKPRPEVYAAMADSLSQAWKDLNSQLELRKQLLEWNVIFLVRAQELTDRMNVAERAFTDSCLPQDAESTKIQLQHHHDIKKSVLETNMHALNEGQNLLDHLRGIQTRGIGDARPEVINQSVSSAIFQTEHILEALHDRRKLLEELWAQRKRLLEEYLQFCLLMDDLNQIQNWLQTRGNEILLYTNLGDSAATAEILQHEHSKLENEVKEIQNRTLRLLRTAEQLSAKHQYRGEETRDYAYHTLERFSDITLHIDNRRSLLNAAVNFFRSAHSVLTKLDQMEIQLTTSDVSGSPVALSQLHRQLAVTIEDTTAPVIAEGYSLLDRVNRDDSGSFGVARTLDEIENRKIKLEGLCTAHKKENIERATALNAFRQSHTKLYSWVINVGEAFLQGHQDMGSVLAMAVDFLQLHERLQHDVENKGMETEVLLKSVNNLVCKDDLEAYEIQEKSETLRNHWMELKNSLEERIRLIAVYVKFHRLAVQVANEMDDLEKILLKETSKITESDLRNIDERWLGIQQLRLQLSNNGKNFVQDTSKVKDPYLDIKRAVLCVETLLEHFHQRHNHLEKLREALQSRMYDAKEFRTQWVQIVINSRKTTDTANQIEDTIYPILRGDVQNPQNVVWELERLNDIQVSNLKRLQAEIEMRHKTIESLTATPDVQAEKDEIVRDLMQSHQRLQTITTEYQILLSMMLTYFKNILEVQKLIDKMNLQYKSILTPSDVENAEMLLREHESGRNTIMELFRFTTQESEQILRHIGKQEPAKVAHFDQEKIQYAIQLKQNQWESVWEDHKRRLEQNLQLCQFNRDLQQINNHLDDLMTQLSKMKGNYGESQSAARATSDAFIQFEKTIELLEQRIQIFVSTAEKMLTEQHFDSHHIRHEIDNVQKKWCMFHRQVGENRMLINLSIEYFKIIEEANEWFRQGSTLLVTIARKSTSCRNPQDATSLLSEVEIFLKPGEAKQQERLRKISSMAIQLYGNSAPTNISLVETQNREMLYSFTVINEELSTLAINLKTAEEQKLRQQKDKEEVDESLAAARAEAAAAKAAAAAAEEAKRAAEAAVRTIPSVPMKIHQIEVVKQEVIPVRKSPTPVKKFESPPKEIRLVAPAFTVPLRDAEIQEATKLKFECRVVGIPTPGIQWYKDGIPIVNNPDYQTRFHDGICTLTIEETFSEDSARFICRATNSVGIAETHGKLTVIESHPVEELRPPEFLRKLEPGFSKEGEAFKFECEVTGNPLPVVSWYKDDVCLDNSPDYIITYNNGISNLSFSNVLADDTARYTCRASNPVGQATSTTKLTVEPLEPLEPPTFVQPLSNVMARTGQKLRLECKVIGTPSPQVMWLHNHRTVKDTPDCKILFDALGMATLTITEAFPKDAGTYVVVARNKAGEAISSCNVSVKGRLPLETSDSELPSDLELSKPHILQPLHDVRTEEGRRIRLDCIIIGQPEPEVIWYHAGKPIKESNDFQLLFEGDKCSLIIKEAYPDDAGDYRVSAINSAGEASSACTLYVEGKTDKTQIERSYKEFILAVEKVTPPKFIKLTTDTAVMEGQQIKLECQVMGEPKPTVNWYKDDQLLLKSTADVKLSKGENGKYALTIPEAFADDSGTYLVKASNKAGDARCYCNVTVTQSPTLPRSSTRIPSKLPVLTTPPTFKRLFTDKFVKAQQSVRFECEITGSPKPKVQWYFKGQPATSNNFQVIVDGETHSLIIPEVKPEDIGRVTCTAENERGKATCSALLNIEQETPKMATQEMIISGVKQNSETMVMKKTTVMKSYQASQSSEMHSSNVGGSMEFHQKSSVEQMAMRQINDQPVEKFHSSRKEEVHKVDDKPAITKEELHVSSMQGAPVRTQQILDRTTTQFPKVESSVRPSVPPKFIQPILSAVVQEGDSVVFEGKVEGYPEPSVKWYKNGAEIFRTDVQMTFENNTVRMKIPHSAQADSGQYTCTARNTGGSASSTSDLIVKAHTEPPMFVKRLQARLVKSGEKVAMEIEVTGVPQPEITWYRNGHLLPKVGKYMLKRDGNVHTLNIQEASTSDSGKFMVKAMNTAGEAQCTADFVVEEPDQPLEIQRITTRQHTSMIEERQQLLTKSSTTTTPVPTQIIKTETVFGKAAPVVPEVTPKLGPQVKMEFIAPTSETFSKTEISMKETYRREVSPQPSVLIVEPPPSAPEPGPEKSPRLLSPKPRSKSKSPEPTRLSRSVTPIRTFSPLVISETSDSTRRALSPIPYAPRSSSPQPSISPVRAPSPRPLSPRPLSPKPVVRAPSPKPMPIMEPSPMVFKREPLPPTLLPGPPARYEFIPPLEEFKPKDEEQLPLPKPGTPPEYGFIAPPPLILPSEMKEEALPPLIKPGARPEYRFAPTPPPPELPVFRPKSPVFRAPSPVVRPASPAPMFRPKSPAATFRAPSPVARPVSPAPMWKAQPVRLPQLPPLQMTTPPQPLPKPGSPPEFGFIPPPEPLVEVVSATMTSITSMQSESYQRTSFPPLEPGPPPEFGFIPPPQQEVRPITPVMVVEIKRSATPVIRPEEHVAQEPAAQPPLFIKVLHDTTINENESVKFECVVSGNPLPTDVQWSFNNQSLPVFRRYHTSYLQGVCRLIISEALLADSGVFACTATNPAGTATTTAALTVQGMVIQSPSPLKPPEAVAPPTFEKLDRNARLVEGGNAIFELVIRGNPSPSVVWTRKGLPIKDSHKYQVRYDLQSGICSLLIKQLQREDEGEYTCTAKNPYGEAICTVFIQAQDVVVQQQKRVQTVQYQQRQQVQQHATTSITTQQQQTIQRKGFVHFERRTEQTIGGQAIEPPSPVYYTNGTDETFRVDTFEYRLLREIEFRESKTRRYASETETETEQEIYETPGKPSAPQIEQRLRNSKLLEGCDATFQAKITGSPRPKITWFKNGQQIISSQRYQIGYKNQIATLYIRMCLPEDAGYYTILSENTVGRVVCSAQLVIEAVGTKDVYSFVRPDRPEDQVDGIGRPITPVRVGYVSTPVPSNLDDAPTKSLQPAFVKVPTDKEVTEGKMVRFDCRVTGRPYPDVSWYLNGRLVLNDTNHKNIVNEAGNHSLLITLANRTDAGQYTCIARNKGGETSFQVNLIVIEKEQVIAPKFVERFQTMHVREGEPTSLHCRAVGAPIPRITWQKDGSQVQTSTNVQIQTESGSSALMFQRAYLTDSAWYQCTAQNIAGSTATRARLFVETEPSFHSEPWRLSLPRPIRVIQPEGSPEREIIWLRHVERARYQRPHEEEDTQIRIAPMFTHPLKDQPNVQEGERVYFEARLVPIGDPTMRIEWYFNGKPLPASSRYLTQYRFGYVTLSILNAYSQDTGTYTCRAVNELGEASTNATLTIIARPAVELSSQHPQSLEKIQALEDWDHYKRQVSVEESVQRPVFVRELKNTHSLRENQNAHFEAQITPMSDPTMKIEWFFNGHPLQASSRINTIYNFGYIALNIMYLRKEDAGTYVVRATNRVGEATSTATLTIVDRTEGVVVDTGVSEQQRFVEKIEELESYQKAGYQRFTEEVTIEVAPRFLTELKPQTNIPEGQTAHFEARLEPIGDTNMKVTWLKDGKPLEASSRITTFFNFGYVALTIKSIYIYDIGTYTCQATNNKGRAVSTSKLTIITSKGVVMESQHPEGLEKIQHLEDSSRYSRRVLEETMIKQIPKFTCPLKGPNQVPEGKPAHFETRLEPQNDSTMKVEWFLNGKPLQTGHRFKTYFDFGYVALDILYVHPQDTGLFTVKATNNSGVATETSEMTVISKTSIDTTAIHKVGYQKIQHLEDSHFVEPHYDIEEISKSKPVFTVTLKDHSPVAEGGHIHLECRLEPTGDPTMRVEWFFNGRPLTIGSRFKTLFDFGYVALDISHAHAEDTGEYTVRATNHLGTAHTSSCVRILSLKSVVYDSQYPESMEKIQALEDSSRYRRTTQEEEYVSKMPTFTKPLHSLDSVEGSNIHLECRLHPVNDPTMKVEWFFNGRPVKTGHRFRPAHDFDYAALDILSVYAEDSGIYTCKAVNQVGEAVTSASVKIIAKSALILESQHPEGLEKIQHLEDSSRYQRDTWTEEVVRIPPKFLTKFKSLDLKEGQNAHFECRLEPVTDPNLKVEWFRNEKTLTIGHRFRPLHDFGYVALDILGVVSEDTGIYTCRATNIAGSDEMSVQLTCRGSTEIITETQHEESLHKIMHLEGSTRYVREEIQEEVTTQAPVFTSTLKNIEIKEGQRAHFECRLIPVSDPNMKVEWFQNNAPVKSGTRFVETNNFGFVALDILTAYGEDSGTYTCKATNPLGSATTSAVLKCHAKRSIYLETQHEGALDQIQYLEDPNRFARPARPDDAHTQPPVFTQPIRNLELMENKSVHFECRLIPTADPDLKVQWFRNGVPLQAANRMSLMHDFGFVALDLSYVHPEDSGTYSCKAINEVGSAVTSATLIVHGQSSLILESQNPEGLQKIQHLEDASRYHRAQYEELIVTQKPRFITPLTGPTKLFEGQSTHMECRIEPFPDPDLKVEWFFNNKPLQVGHRFRTTFDFGFAALDILTVYPEDAGEYTIVATNKLGTAKSSLTIFVTGKGSLILETQNPEGLEKIQMLEDTSRHRRPAEKERAFTEKPQFGRGLQNLDRLAEGQSAHLEGTVTPVNDPSMKVEWFFNGRPITQGHRFKTTFDFGYVALDILYVYPEDSGTYMCKASNDVGEAVSTCSIFVEAKRSIYSDTLHEEGLRKIQALETTYERPREEVLFVSRPPEFMIPLVNQEHLKEGDSLHLETRLEPINDPFMKVEWFINGIEIKAGHRFRTTHDFGYVALDILYVYPEDCGTYMCKATNQLGEAVTSCSIKIQSRRSIYVDTQHPEGWEKIRELESQPKYAPLETPERPVTKPFFVTPLVGTTDLLEGQHAHMECRVEPVHDPQLTIEFFHNGRPLVAGSRFHITFDFGYVALDITSVVPEDEGEYTVVVKNDLGEAQSSITIRVQAKSSIISDTHHREGLEQIRQLEERPLAPARADFVEGHTSQRPVFTIPLQNVDNLVEDEPGHLECRLIPVGDPKLKVEWFFNEKPLQQSSRFRTTHDFGYVALDVDYVRSEDTGFYMCRAANDLGEAVTTCSIKVRSKASILYDTKHPEGLEKIRRMEDTYVPPAPDAAPTMYEKPVFTVALTGPTDLLEGQMAHYECRVIPIGDPDLKFDWFINGVELRPSARARTVHDFGVVTLDIGSVIPEDSGVYMCKASNKAGEAVTSIGLKVRGFGGVMSEPLCEEALIQIQKFEDDRHKVPVKAPERPPQAPVFTRQLQSQEQLVEGKNVHLEATVEPINDEKLRIEWFKNGMNLTLGTRMQTMFDFGLVTLDISSIRPDDSGIYTCRAVNEVGEAVTTCSLKVAGYHWLIGAPQHPESLDKIRKLEEPRYQSTYEVEPQFDPPVFITHLNNIECNESDFARFECQVEPAKDPNLKIEFTFNGKPLPLATKFTVTNDLGHITLDVSHAYPEDSGIYMCRATNRKGQAVTSGSLKVQGKRSIIYDTQHPMGEQGLGRVQEVDEAYLSRYQHQFSETEVGYPKPVFTIPLQPEFAPNESESLHLECHVEPAADPRLTVEWFLNGKALEMGSRFRFLHDFGHVVLDISDMWPRDSGVYTCRAKNNAGEAFTTTTISITARGVLLEGTLHPKGEEGLEKIQTLEDSLRYMEQQPMDEDGQPPCFTSQFENLINLTEGDIAHFEASLTPAGDQTMVVEWFFNHEPLKAGHRIRTVHAFGMVVLEILGVYLEDTGEYTCRATNKWGRAEITVKLECTDKSRGHKPHFTTQLQCVNLNEGDSAHLECHLIPVGDPKMKVEWFHNGKPLRDSSRIKTLSDFGYVVLDISFVESGDIGEYVCRASNQYGEDTTRATVQFLGPDGPNQPPKYTTHIQSLETLIEGQSAHFEATLIPTTDPNLKVEWYFNGKKLQHGHRFRTFHDFGVVILDILYCYEEDSGVYEARAVNQIGSDVTRANLKCRSKASLIFDTQLPKEMEGGLEKIQYLEDALYRSQFEMRLDGKRQPPVFTVPLENVSGLREGENAHLEAKLIPVDDPRLKVEWFKNGKPILSGSRLRTIHDFGFVVLELSPVYPEDSGEYMCRAKNDLGEAVTKCTIQCEGKRGIILDTQLPKGMETGVDKIAQLEGYSNAPIPEKWMDVDEANPPRFITQPQDLMLMENSLAHFECRLIPVNDTSLRVDWYHNGKALTAGSRVKTICDFGYVILEIAGVYSRDAGLYTCKAVNKHGEASVSCKLSVKSKLGIIMEPQLPSEFKSGTESLQRLEESLYHRVEKMDEDDVPHPPIFITQIQDLPNLFEGEPAHFECRVEPIGDSSMRLEWFHDGRPLDSGSRVHTLDDFGFVVLDVDWTFPRDCGEYICRATNKWGTAMTKATLACKGKRDIIIDSQLPKGINADKLRELECPPVHERPVEDTPLQPPKFTTQIQPLENLTEGEPAHFECRLIPVNDPKLKVEWFHNGKPLMSGHRFKTTHDFGYVALDILYVHAEDSGEYLARASNELGEDTTRTTLTCKSAMNVILFNQIPREMQAKDIVVQMEATLRKYTNEVHLGEGDIFTPEKGMPPKFITQIQDRVDLKEMENAKFECLLTPVGDPNMKVEWFFNGRPLSFKNRFTPIYDFGYVALDFAWVNPQDCGEYVCRATNLYGSDETRAVLKCAGSSSIVRESQLPKEMRGGMKKIEEMEAAWQRHPGEEEVLPRERCPPTFVLKLEPCIVEEGEWAKFRCRVTGNPRPRILWIVNGKTVVTGSRYKMSYDGMFRMDIPKSRQYDAGKVDVVARNSLGEAYCSTTLEVRPRLDDYRALLKRSPRPWYDDGVKTYQDERKELEVVRKFEEHLAPMTSNVYHVDKGTREHLCTRLEKDDSELKEVFKKRRIEAQGAYIHPEEQLSEEERDQRLKDSITLVQGMAKDYDEVVENIPPSYKKKSKYRTRQRDSKSYIAAPSPTESSVHGKEIHTQKQTQTQKEKKGDLEITRKTTVTETVEQEHKGTTKERIVFGKVPESIPPVLTKKIQPCRAYEGESAKFECEFTGTPTPNVTWYRENFPIKDSQDFQITATDTKSTLFVREVFMEDSGVFSVIAQNRGGTAKSTSNLVVEERREKPKGPVPPSFLATAQDVRVKAGQLARLDTKVSGSKPLDVYWLKNGQKIAIDIRYKILEEDDVYTLLIIEAFPEDVGTYECVAINKSGEARCQAQVYVEAPTPKQTKPEAKPDKNSRAPSVIMDLKDTSVREGQAAIFRCRLSAQPAPQVKWYRDDNLIKPSRYFRMSHEGDQYVLRISEAFPEDEGTYKFAAENPAGKVNLSAKLKVLVPDAIVPPTVASFKDVTVPEGRPARFATQVSGTPAPTVQWFREGVLIPQSQDFQMTQDNNQCTLTITTTYPEDSGRYICRATNPSGQAEASAMLRVESKR